MNIKMFDENELPHDLLLTTIQKTKLRNAFENNMSTGIKLSKTQISKKIQSGGFLGTLLSNMTVPLMKNQSHYQKNYIMSIRKNCSCFSS